MRCFDRTACVVYVVNIKSESRQRYRPPVFYGNSIKLHVNINIYLQGGREINDILLTVVGDG